MRDQNAWGLQWPALGLQWLQFTIVSECWWIDENKHCFQKDYSVKCLICEMCTRCLWGFTQYFTTEEPIRLVNNIQSYIYCYLSALPVVLPADEAISSFLNFPCTRMMNFSGKIQKISIISKYNDLTTLKLWCAPHNVMIAVILHPLWGSRVPSEHKLRFFEGRLWGAWTKIAIATFPIQIQFENSLWWSRRS